jgi:hypothetical protein
MPVENDGEALAPLLAEAREVRVTARAGGMAHARGEAQVGHEVRQPAEAPRDLGELRPPAQGFFQR